MKRALVLATCLIAALALASAAAANTATTAKKKKTYCQKQAASIKAKLKGKSHGFYAYAEKGGTGILICQDKPKFTGEFSVDKGDKISTLRVAPKKCAGVAFRGPTHNPEVYLFNFADFLSGNGSASVFQTAYDQPPGTASLVQFNLSSNCVAVFGQRVAGVPQVVVKGTSAFGYTGGIFPVVSANMTDKELGAVKISGSGDTAKASWTDAGVPKSYVYTNSPQPLSPLPTSP
jgi:hypothetical protein